MATCLGIVVLCLLLTEARLETTFQVTRGLKDKFTNPHCVYNKDCTASQCAQYFARCVTKSCAVCICDQRRPTYVASEKKCLKDDDILPQTVPEYSSFAISNDDKEPYLSASTTSNKLEKETRYHGNPNQLWLYTPKKKLLNLKTLKCLHSDGYNVALGQCLADTNETQTWYCSSDSIYTKHRETNLYLSFLGIHFSLGKQNDGFRWVASKDPGTLNRSICDIPDSYKGCYRFEDGSSLKRFSSNKTAMMDCKGKHDVHCYEKMRVSAPIFRSDKQGRGCSIARHDSEFSVDDQSWTEFQMNEKDFDYSGRLLPSGKIEFKFHVNVKTVWAGALMKLNVECFDSREKHYILLKFDGVFNESLQEHPPTRHPTIVHSELILKTPDMCKNSPQPLNTDSRYKNSVIALSVVLGVMFIIVGVLAVLMSRKKITRTWTTSNADDDISVKPFCSDEERL